MLVPKWFAVWIPRTPRLVRCMIAAQYARMPTPHTIQASRPVLATSCSFPIKPAESVEALGGAVGYDSTLLCRVPAHLAVGEWFLRRR